MTCPSCAATYAATERFCDDCGMPLVPAGEADDRPRGEAAERARKVRPQYAEGPLVRVATARHQAEAEMLENLLLDHGVPALVRRSGGFDVPDFLASGPRDILVPASGAELAREVLGVPEAPASSTIDGSPPWVRALAVALAVGILALIAAGVFAAVF